MNQTAIIILSLSSRAPFGPLRMVYRIMRICCHRNLNLPHVSASLFTQWMTSECEILIYIPNKTIHLTKFNLCLSNCRLDEALICLVASVDGLYVIAFLFCLLQNQ